MVINLVQSKLGAAGCGDLVTNNLENLRELRLGKNWIIIDKNNVREKGIEFLCQGNWQNLQKLDLSIISI